MNELEIELLRVKLSAALIHLSRVAAGYGHIADLVRAQTAIEQANAVLIRASHHLDDWQ
jgi:outer membrane protein TolC